MDIILITTKNGGKKTLIAKILASGLFVIVVSFIFFLTDYLAFSVFFDNFGGNSTPLYYVYAIQYWASAIFNSIWYTKDVWHANLSV